jgi:hypothetical protein
VDTSVARDFQVKYTVTADGVADKVIVVSLKVSCGINVNIVEPSLLQLATQLLLFTVGTGAQIYSMESFSTDVASCPINKYQLTSAYSQITQPACPSTSDSSDACKQLSLTTNEAKTYTV